ncbi:MAG TPA: tRNA pseudouridine(38-40) synthase TruA [Anaeromyxobacter sp.]|nr:tRNA pseudouridine(38-40) synthase TruA [Anaeromyxobacter sp.]
MERRFYAMRLWYDGGRFRGFQRQRGLPTVEQALEDALPVALGQARACPRLVAAARTDAGVHALGQVVSFSARAALDPQALRRALNGALPDGVAVVDAWAAGPGFHARASARSRTYVYLVGSDLPAGLRPYAWSLPDARAFPGGASRIDPAVLRAAIGQAVGEHDFSGLARPGGQGKARRTLLRAEVVSATWVPLHAVVVEGTGFARAVVRNLVGTAVAAGLGLAPPSAVADRLERGGRYRGVRAPGWGLTLASVAYSPIA